MADVRIIILSPCKLAMHSQASSRQPQTGSESTESPDPARRRLAADVGLVSLVIVLRYAVRARIMLARSEMYGLNVAIIYLLFGATVARAQGSVPADLESGAAYCLGFKDAMRTWIVTTSPKPADPSSAEIFQQWKNDADDEIKRLRTYLIAHGHLTAAKEPEPFILATQAGAHDAAECSTTVEKNKGACNQNCSQLDAIPACQSGAKCAALEASLP
jgi:hypothetical protein